MMTRYW